jgi:hypothetical protein
MDAFEYFGLLTLPLSPSLSLYPSLPVGLVSLL